MKDDLGKRMKEQYEQRTRTWLPRRTYTIIRLDGKAFHTFTRGMDKPYDVSFIEAMNETAKYLCANVQGCKMAYVQSDEISLLLTDFERITTDAWFDGQIQKIVSVAASMATAKFNPSLQAIQTKYNEDPEPVWSRIDAMVNAPLAMFDARVFTIADPVEVENYFVWRQKDAVRNSLAMHAQSLFSHKELNGKSQANMHDMIVEKGENWNDLPSGFKRGRTIVKVRSFDIENIGSTDDVIDLGTKWSTTTPDFLKEREDLTDLIPRIDYDLV
jgi:tRNA(His) 5'-end guanylyltransferase